jgi:hypothetical protein
MIALLHKESTLQFGLFLAFAVCRGSMAAAQVKAPAMALEPTLAQCLDAIEKASSLASMTPPASACSSLLALPTL